jgi:hypothetical protein
MEFFFLTQNVTLEIVVLIIIVLVLIGIWSQELYAKIGSVWSILKEITSTIVNKKIVSEIPDLSKKDSKPHTIKNEIDKETVSETIIDKETTDTIETLQLEKVDTSQVEKLTNLVSSVRTLIARGMIHEAQTLIVE